MIKTLRRLEIKVNFLNSIKGIYEKSPANMILKDERLSPYGQEYEKDFSFLVTSI